MYAGKQVLHLCRSLEDTKERLAATEAASSAAAAAHATAIEALEAQASQQQAAAAAAASAAAAAHATACEQLEARLSQMQSEAAARDAAFSDALRQLDAAAAQVRAAEAGAAEGGERLRLAEERAAAADASAQRFQAANDELAARCAPAPLQRGAPLVLSLKNRTARPLHSVHAIRRLAERPPLTGCLAGLPARDPWVGGASWPTGLVGLQARRGGSNGSGGGRPAPGGLGARACHPS